MSNETAQREPTEQELKRWEAEAAKFAAEQQQAEANARKANAEAAYAESQAAAAAIDLEREQYKRDVELASPTYRHVYHFNTEVSAGSAGSCMKALDTWSQLEPGCDMEIVFSSPGGSVVDGMALFDYIKQVQGRGHKINTSTLGMAASMAGILLQAGDVRSMSPESWLLIHEVSFGASGSFGEVEDRVKWVEKVQNRVLDIFAERVEGADPQHATEKLTREQIEKGWLRTDWWIDADFALKHGLIDVIK